jgi:hypothetical protein
MRTNEQGQNLIDDLHTSTLANTVETRVNATIAGRGNPETRLAGEDLASSVIAEDRIDVRDILAVLAVGDVTPERRSNGATTTCNLILSTTFTTLEQKCLQLSASLLISTQSWPFPPLGTPQMVFPAGQVGESRFLLERP